MEKKFEVGQKVKVLPGKGVSGEFNEGDVLTVRELDRGWPLLLTAGGRKSGKVGGGGWSPTRFELFKEPKPVIDFTKPLETADGRPVVIVTTEGRGDYPVLAYVGDKTTADCFTATGKYYLNTTSKSYDLQNVPPKPQERDLYLNVYKNSQGVLVQGSAWKDRATADENQSVGRAACLKIKLIEGQFDD